MTSSEATLLDIQRFEPWPQEWPMEDNDGDLVLYEDHVKIVEALKADLAELVEALKWQAEQPEVHPFMVAHARAALNKIKEATK